LLALGFLAVTLCGWEYILRDRGYHPSVEDSMELWSWQRQRATGSTPIVLLGASRLLHGIDTATLRRRYPHKPIVNLAIKGKYPLAVLQHLAADESFAGTVVVSVVAQALEPVYEDMQQEYVDFFDEHSRLNGRINARMMAGLEHRFVSLHPLLSLQYLGNYLYKYGRYPKPFYMWTLEDRSIDGDFQLVNSMVLRARFVRQKAANYRNIPPSKPDVWLRAVDEINKWVMAIHSRGGKVVMLRFPTVAGHWTLDEQYYPRHLYWDRFAAASEALCVHIHDVPGAKQFVLPDGSHLDSRESPAFTAIVFDYLEKEGLFQSGAEG
jgi:hypothetical protein